MWQFKGIDLPKLNISCSPPFGCRFWGHFLIRKCYASFTGRIASSQTKAHTKKQRKKNVTVLHCGCVVSSRLPEDHNSVPPECWWIRKCHQSLQTVLSSERIKKMNRVHWTHLLYIHIYITYCKSLILHITDTGTLHPTRLKHICHLAAWNCLVREPSVGFPVFLLDCYNGVSKANPSNVSSNYVSVSQRPQRFYTQ